MSDNPIYFVASMQDIDFGTYHVVVKSMNDCGETQSDNIVISDLSVIDNSDPNFRILSVTPNPVSNNATINFVLSQDGDVTFSLVDLSGRELGILHTGFFNEGESNIYITDKFSSLSSGSYFLLLESRGRKTAIKITISR